MRNTIVLLPAYNEVKTIGLTIEDIRHYVPDARIIVVDNNSRNGTGNVVRSMGVPPFDVKEQGKGNAIRYALKLVNTEYCIMIDSDFTYPASYIPSIIDNLQKGADVVMGYRKFVDAGAMTTINKFGNRMLSLLASALYGLWVHDVCTGMWGFRREVLDKFKLTSKGFTLEVDMFVNAVNNGCKIRQMPISYRARLDGSKAKLRVSDGFKIGWFLIKNKFC